MEYHIMYWLLWWVSGIDWNCLWSFLMRNQDSNIGFGRRLLFFIAVERIVMSLWKKWPGRGKLLCFTTRRTNLIVYIFTCSTQDLLLTSVSTPPAHHFQTGYQITWNLLASKVGPLHFESYINFVASFHKQINHKIIPVESSLNRRNDRFTCGDEHELRYPKPQNTGFNPDDCAWRKLIPTTFPRIWS